MNTLESELDKRIRQDLKQRSAAQDSQFANIVKYLRTKKGVNYLDPDGKPNETVDLNTKASINHSGQEMRANNGLSARMQLSIHDYRAKFDSQNIAVTKYEEIKKVRQLSNSYQSNKLMDQTLLTSKEEVINGP